MLWNRKGDWYEWQLKKDSKTGKWTIQYRYTDWQGITHKTTKRGFATKREAENWEREFQVKNSKDFNMKFSDFLDIYMDDMEKRLKKSTMDTKRNIINSHILPYFKEKSVSKIDAADIRRWQGEIIEKDFSSTYLKTVNNQLNALFNYAIQFYNLSSNPCRRAGSMCSAKAEEMKFWTKDEFMKFIDKVMDKRVSYMAFMILFWTGMRKGELMALTPADIDLEAKRITISKTRSTDKGEKIITSPKTSKSNRSIALPEFLAIEIDEYMNSLYGLKKKDLIFPFNDNYLNRELDRGAELAGVKRIRVHDLRHSHASLLIEMNFNIKEVSDRLGHEKIETTLNLYSHLYPDKQEAMADKLNDKYKEEL